MFVTVVLTVLAVPKTAGFCNGCTPCNNLGEVALLLNS
nr:MAG TPA: hypothetical protein [Caudoviricetes sp.]